MESFKTKDQETVELQDLGGGHWRAVCGDRSFRTDERDGDLWTDHREMARFYEYDDRTGPGSFEGLINECVRAGLINESDLIRFEENRSDGRPGRKSRVILLRRRAALLVSARCNQPRAMELTRKMAEVFERWLDRRHRVDLGALQTLANAIVKLQEQQGQLVTTLAHITERVMAIEDRLVAQDGRHGLISTDRRDEILAEFRFFADCFYKRKTREWAQKRAYYDKEVRKVALLPMGMAWDRLPASRDDVVENKLRDLRKEIPEEARKEREAQRVVSKQGLLFTLIDGDKKAKS